MIYFNQQSDTYSSSLSNKIQGLQIGFTTKQIGDCRHISIIQDYFKANDLSNNKIVLLEQIHSANISFTNSRIVSRVEQISECDGVLSSEDKIILVVRTADCLPVIFFSLPKGYIGAAHIGWRGTLKNLIGKMIRKMNDAGIKNHDIYIVVGPAINQCCYEVDIDTYSEFMSTMERFKNVAFKPHGEKYRLNLTRLNYELALESGIDRNHIDHFPFCTSCNSDVFFSFRRDYKKNPLQFGEMMGFVSIQ